MQKILFLEYSTWVLSVRWVKASGMKKWSPAILAVLEVVLSLIISLIARKLTSEIGIWCFWTWKRHLLSLLFSISLFSISILFCLIFYLLSLPHNFQFATASLFSPRLLWFSQVLHIYYIYIIYMGSLEEEIDTCQVYYFLLK